jgi:hypothetical protein
MVVAIRGMKTSRSPRFYGTNGPQVDIEPSIGSIHGDEARLEQVVWNLLTTP